MDRTRNRKLLVSLFGPQEAREAILGSARIVDSEDLQGALGNIKPQRIMDISDAALAAKRELVRQIQKSPYEIAGKALTKGS